MLTMYVQTDGGRITETTSHGWASADQAVQNWKLTFPGFKAYRNGRQTVNGNGVVTRVWFDA